MPRIVTETVTISFSKLVKANDPDPDRIIEDDDLENITNIVEELYQDDARVVEISEVQSS